MCAFPYVCDGFDVGCAGFIVKYLCIHFDAPCLETFHDGIIGWDAMLVQDYISCIVVCKHNVLVAAHCADWKAP